MNRTPQGISWTTGGSQVGDRESDQALGRSAVLDYPAEAGEVALNRRVRQGEPEARDLLVTQNLKLVARIARDFEGRGLALEDLVGEGNLGLIRAARRFDPNFGVPFGTYASHWIKQSIRHALASTTAAIRIPSHMIRLLTKCRRAELAYLARHGHRPSREALATLLGLTEAKLKMLDQALVALGRPARGGLGARGRPALEELPSGGTGPDSLLMAEEDRGELRAFLARLGERERRLLTSRYGLDGGRPATLAEAGRWLGISRGWASRIERRAIHRLGRELGARRDVESPLAGSCSSATRNDRWD